MLREVIQARCDRCGQNKCYEHGGIITAKSRIRDDGWEERLDKLLCADCLTAFDNMVETFFNEIIDV